MSAQTEYMPHKGDAVLIQELAMGSTKVAAAGRAGVHVNTIAGRLADPHFRKLVNKHRSEILSETAGILSRVATKAATRLEELICDEHTPDHVVQNACRTVLDYTMRMRETMALDDRITEIEELLEQEAEL